MSHERETKHDAELLAAARSLPTEIQPTRDLWPNIEKELREDKVITLRVGPVARRLLSVAALIVVFFAGLSIGFLRNQDEPEVALAPTPPEAPEVASPDETDVRGVLPDTERVFGLVDREFSEAMEGLLASHDSSEAKLNPATLELIRENLRTIDRAIADLQRAMESDPESVRLQRMLQTEVNRRSGVLRQAADLKEQI